MNLFLLQRFQRTYEALEQEGMEERRQLNAIHQQRVQFDLNNKKRDAMEKYMDVSSQIATFSERISVLTRK